MSGHSQPHFSLFWSFQKLTWSVYYREHWSLSSEVTSLPTEPLYVQYCFIMCSTCHRYVFNLCSKGSNNVLNGGQVVSKGSPSTPTIRIQIQVKFTLFYKMDRPRPLFHLFSSFQTHTITIFTTNKYEKCHVHPVDGPGIWTHNLWNMSLLP